MATPLTQGVQFCRNSLLFDQSFGIVLHYLRRHLMATSVVTKTAAKGGSFLLESPAALDVFTPADLTDDQKLIGQTAEEFVLKEVLPLAKDLENKKPGLMAELIRKGGELGLMGGGVPEEYGGPGLDKIAATILTHKLYHPHTF